MYKIFLQYPDSLRVAFPRLREKLDDEDICIPLSYMWTNFSGGISDSERHMWTCKEKSKELFIPGTAIVQLINDIE